MTRTFSSQFNLAQIRVDEACADILRAILVEIETGISPKPELGIRYRPAKWFGELTEAERQAYSRALRKLDDAGLVERMTERRRDRVAHVRITPIGLWKALELNPGADRDTIAEDLAKTDWGANVLDGLVPQPDGDEIRLDLA